MSRILDVIKRKLTASVQKVDVAPITAVLPPFDTPEFLARTNALTDSFVREHALNVIQQGYTVVPNAVDVDLIAAADASFENWKNRNKQKFRQGFYRFDNRMDRIINIQASLPEFQPLFAVNRSLAVQDYLFQGETVLYTSLFFEVGSTQDVHRDIPLFWTNPAGMYFGTWTALEDSDADNGPLVVVPGSHRLPLLDRDKIAREKYTDLSAIKQIDGDLWESYQARIASLCEEQGLGKQTVHVKRGDTLIWHPLLVHGGAKIQDMRRTRKSLVVHTIPKDVSVYQSDVFFNVDRKVPGRVTGRYVKLNGRLLSKFDCLSIGHEHTDFDFSQLR